MAGAVLAVVAVLALTACRTVYSGWESSIDGPLWRQIAAVDPRRLPVAGVIWDGHDPESLAVTDGAVVLFDVERSGDRFRFGVFIPSGPRTDEPTDAGDVYHGPSQVFTCFGVDARFVGGDAPEAARDTTVECPVALVALMPSDAAFATDDVFDG